MATDWQTPIPPQNTIRELDPALTKGNGMPVGGILPVTTAIFISTCTPISAAMPPAIRQPNRSALCVSDGIS